MKLEILHVPGCPNVEVLERRLDEVLAAENTSGELVHRVIDDELAAVAAGMAGSPTLLVDGRDPFATAGQQPSVSCRLFRDEEGALRGAPSVAALRAALGFAARTGSAAAESAGDACCSSASGADTAAASLGSARRRAKPADPAQRAVHQCILRGFASHGTPPSMAELAGAAAGFEPSVEKILAGLLAD